MNRKDIIRMARKAGFEAYRGYGLLDHVPEDVFAASVNITREIERFAALVAASKPAVPKRKPLTDEQKLALCKQFPDHLTFNAINAIEAAHGIKGNA